MTAIEMQIKFEQLLKTHDIKDLNILDITSNVSYFLTEAQRKIVEYYYDIFETNEKAKKILAPLVLNVNLTRTSVNSTQTGVHPNGEYWKLPDDLMYALKEEATLGVDSCGTSTSVGADRYRSMVKPINIDYYNIHKDNPFKTPYTALTWRLDITSASDKIHELITGGARVEKYHLTYLKYPTSISIEEEQDSILPELIHQDIVTGAVKMALEVLYNNINLNRKQNG